MWINHLYWEFDNETRQLNNLNRMNTQNCASKLIHPSKPMGGQKILEVYFLYVLLCVSILGHGLLDLVY